MESASELSVRQKEISELGLGDHLCCIYRDASEQMEMVIPYLIFGLNNHEKCIYIVEESTKDDVEKAFSKSGVDLDKYIRSGQFVFLTKEDAYLKGGSFDPDRMIATLKKAEEAALKEGYAGLRVTGEMTWIFAKLPGVERLIEYEAKLNYFLPDSRSTAICQYHENRFDPDILIDVIHTHPKVVIYGLVCENPYYISPDSFLLWMKRGKFPLTVYRKIRDDIIARARLEKERKKMEAELRENLENAERSRRAMLSTLEDEKLAKEALRQSEERYRELISNINAAVAVYDAVDDGEDFVFKDFNRAGERIEQISRDKVIGKRVTEVFPAVREFGIFDVFKRVWQTGVPEHYPASMYQDDRIAGWRDNFVYKLPSGEVVAVYEDVTERRKAEERLRRINDCFLKLGRDFDKNIQLLTALCGELLGADCALYNRLEEDILFSVGQWKAPEGYNPKDRPEGHICFDVIQRKADDVYVVQDLEQSRYAETDPNVKAYGLKTYIGKAVKHGGKNVGSLCVVYTRDHEPTGDDKRVMGILATALGAEEDRRAAQQILREFARELELRVVHRTKELQDMNRELESFSYSISHDLRAPLRSMYGFSQALIEDYSGVLDEKGKDYLKRICSSGEEMGELIDDILELSHISRSEIKKESIDLSGLANEIADELKKMDPGRNVEFLISPGMAVDGDRQLMRDVMENLMENAWKFTSPRPDARIEVGSLVSDGITVFFVKDNGVGFDMQYAGKLFKPFERLHAKGEFPGTGIGLATIARIVGRHGGRAWAEGKVGEGATFYFTLS